RDHDIAFNLHVVVHILTLVLDMASRDTSTPVIMTTYPRGSTPLNRREVARCTVVFCQGLDGHPACLQYTCPARLYVARLVRAVTSFSRLWTASWHALGQ